MNNSFNLKRFAKVLKKDAQELLSQYLKLILIVTCTFFAVILLFILNKNNDNIYIGYRQTCFAISSAFIWGSMLLAPFQLYKRYNHKIYGVNYFMLPASQAEKWMSMFFYCAIATPVIIILTITLINLCAYSFFPWMEKPIWLNFHTILNPNKPFDIDTILNLFAFQSLLFLGNIWFKRAKVQKTIAMIVFLMIGFVLIAILAQIGKVEIMSGFSEPLPINITSNVSKTWQTISKTITFLVAPIGLWIVSLMKMKEQEL